MMDSPVVVTGDSGWEQTHMVQIEIEDKKHGEISPCFIFHRSNCTRYVVGYKTISQSRLS